MARTNKNIQTGMQQSTGKQSSLRSGLSYSPSELPTVGNQGGGHQQGQAQQGNVPLVDKPVGTGSDGISLEIPKIIPVYAVPEEGSAVPLATPLDDPSSISIDFNIPHGAFGPFIMMGWYAMFCRPGEGPNANDYPLVWMDPDAGISSDVSGTPTNPPFFVGCNEGSKIMYNLTFAEDNIVTTHHGHFKDNWRVLPFPIELPTGARGRLTVTRLKCDRFAPDETVYLYFGIFGRQRLVIPPPFDVSSCDEPVRLVAYTTGQVEVPADTTLGVGTLSRSVRRNIPITNRHPTLIDGMLHTGPDHLLAKVGWQQGFMNDEFVPARLFNYLRGARTAAPILLNAPTDMQIEYVQPLVVPEQQAAIAAMDIEGGAYGW